MVSKVFEHMINFFSISYLQPALPHINFSSDYPFSV